MPPKALKRGVYRKMAKGIWIDAGPDDPILQPEDEPGTRPKMLSVKFDLGALVAGIKAA